MDTITAVLISVHVLISVALIALVLLNSGKGGGLSDMLGGPGSYGNIGQTLAERNLGRITALVAQLVAATTFSLFWFLDQVCAGGGTGRRAGLRILWGKTRGGSSPLPRTN